MVPASLPRPLGPDDHIEGPGGRPARARHVRRLRMPLLRRLAGDPRARTQATRRRAALRVPPPAAGVRAPARAPRRRGGRGRAAQGGFWEMHDALFSARGRLEDADLVAHARSSASTPSGSGASSPTARTRPASSATRRTRQRSACARRRCSSPTASGTRRLQRRLARRGLAGQARRRVTAERARPGPAGRLRLDGAAAAQRRRAAGRADGDREWLGASFADLQ